MATETQPLEDVTMQSFRRIGVFLSDSPADEGALAYACKFGELANCERLYCMYVRGSADQDLGPDPDPKTFTARVQSAIPANLRDRVTIAVRPDTGVAEVLRCARDESLDLAVVCRRLPTDQLSVGTVYRRLARKCPCTVLAVPPHSYPHVSRLLVSVDGSRHSKVALHTAIAIARGSGHPNPQVVAQTIYEVKYGYRYSGKNFHEAGRAEEEARRQRNADFLKDVDTSGVEFDTVYTCSDEPASAIHSVCAALKMDLIVLGSRGARTSAASILSSTVETVLVGASQPVLIVKRKGETLGLLDALLPRV